MRLTVFSLLLVCGCAGVPRPDTDLCVANVPGKNRKCYNLLRDYDNTGERIPGAKPTYKPLTSLNDINKSVMTDPTGFANLKAYLRKLRDEATRSCQ